MRHLITIPGLILVLFAARPALGQSRWSVEATGDAAIPTGTFAGADVKTGGGFGANARFSVQPHLAVYAGWEWHLQKTQQLLSDETLDLNDTGYTFGLRFEHPFGSERPSGTGPGYWFRAGGLLNHIEIENEDGDTIYDTGHGLGWEAGAGLTVPLGARLGLTPGVRYRSLSRDVAVGGPERSATLAYVTAGLGLAYSF